MIEEREKVARWMIANSLATGHGDTIDDLLSEASWQIAELRSKIEKMMEGALFVDLKGEWWNANHIVKIEPFRQQKFNEWGEPILDAPTEIKYVATLSNGDKRGLTDEEFRTIMNVMRVDGS